MVADLVDHALNLFPKALDLERGSPSGIANLIFIAAALCAFVGLLTHALFYIIADFLKSGLYAILNFIGRILSACTDYPWTDLGDKNVRPSRPTHSKEFGLLLFTMLACPLTIALIHHGQ